MLAIDRFHPSLRASLLGIGLAFFAVLGQAADPQAPAEGVAPKAEPATEQAAPASKEAAPAKAKAKAKAKAPASAHKTKSKKKPTRAKSQARVVQKCGVCTYNSELKECDKATNTWTCTSKSTPCDNSCT